MTTFFDKTIFVVSPNNWGPMYISKHHYAIELAKKGNRVFFINPPKIKSSLFQVTNSDVHPNLKIVSYNPIFRGKNFLPNFLFNFLVRLQIKMFSVYLRVKPDVVFSFSSNYFLDLKWFEANLTIYCPYDQINTIEGKKIAHSADFTITISDFIFNEVASTKNPVLKIDHGVGSDFIGYADKKIVSDYADITRRIKIGFVGNLFIGILDREAFKKIISENPTIDFTFWGPKKPSDSNVSSWVEKSSLEFVIFLHQQKNVILKGVCLPSIVAKEIQDMDGFIYCNLIHPENKSLNSHKILEYLSTGKMVISTYLDEYAKKNTDLLCMHTPSNNEFFPDFFKVAILNISKNNSKVLQTKRISFSISNSYQNQLSKIESWIESFQK